MTVVAPRRRILAPPRAYTLLMRRKLLLAVVLAAPFTLLAANNQLLGWNNLGMHCMQSDYSVFSILPPYNTINAQLIVCGKLDNNGSGTTVRRSRNCHPRGTDNESACWSHRSWVIGWDSSDSTSSHTVPAG